jgi:hypothetical protein
VPSGLKRGHAGVAGRPPPAQRRNARQPAFLPPLTRRRTLRQQPLQIGIPDFDKDGIGPRPVAARQCVSRPVAGSWIANGTPPIERNWPAAGSKVSRGL